MTTHRANLETLPRLVVIPVRDDRPNVRWVGKVVERAVAAAIEVNAALLIEMGRTSVRLVVRHGTGRVKDDP